MRRALVGAALVAAGCATTAGEAPEVKARRAAAEECARQSPDVRITGYDAKGLPTVRSTSVAALSRFRDCLQRQVTRRAEEAAPRPGRLAPVTGSETTGVPLEIAGRSMIAVLTINGHGGARLLLDTGATGTVLSPALAARVGVVVPRDARRRSFVVAGGARHEAPVVRLDSLGAGDAVIRDIEVSVFDVMPGRGAVDGLLGTDFLNHFRYTVDRQARRLVLTVPFMATAPPLATTTSSSRTWPLPAWTPGTEWRYRSLSDRREAAWVEKVTGDDTVDGRASYVVQSGPRVLRVHRDTLGWFEVSRDRQVVARLTGDTGWAWPLRVGLEWQQQAVREDVAAGRSETISRTCTVVAEERVRVPAGTFDTAKISCNDAAGRVVESWYADEAATSVKDRSVTGAREEWRELVSYKRP